MAELRLFVAVLITDDLKRRAAEVQDDLRRAAVGVKWVEPANFHITMKFLGGVDESRVDVISGALESVVGGVEPFDVSLAGAGAFPNLSRPQVVWIGVKDGTQHLRPLAEAIEAVLEPEGFPREDRKFKAHITIGRVRDSRKCGALPDVLRVHEGDEFGSFSVDRIALMKSELRKEGPIYTVLREFVFPQS
jgi:2'-5' RNA ligase